ncbi:ABC transporter ATP-binding protein [Leptolyngbya sp. KIOST-1]|uniref:ABC transporter ATP-binding protein n=1 Tax=Leptolyngbya sp. KIOST-1 TaxID=1229172 RepID=UPI000569665B|nr:ABC transporter ATP-binding protein [Leptolyngbya sp. KIOST-1]
MTLVAANTQAMTAPKDSDVVLSVQGVSKKFCRDFKSALFYGMQDISSEVLGLRGDKNDRLRKKEFWALQDVSFELRRGEALGLVGKNGSGKSTLLRVIAGLIKPDVGSVTVRGRVAPLIALGAGFNPVLTGRENIYANMSILGLSKAEIDDRFDDVVAFAEIPDAIDSPVRSYSSGMQARLGFACAVFTEPDILLIDEVLAVGDSRFRAKCFRQLNDLRKKDVTFILVSHNSNSILTVCESSAYLRRGNLIDFGDSTSVMKKYEEDLFIKDKESAEKTLSTRSNYSEENPNLNISDVFFEDELGDRINSPKTGHSTYFCIEFDAKRTLDNVTVAAIIKGMAEGGEAVLYLNSTQDGKTFHFKPGHGKVKIFMPSLGLRVGTYLVDIFIKEGNLCRLDTLEGFSFSVKSESIMDRCLYYQPREWQHSS